VHRAISVNTLCLEPDELGRQIETVAGLGAQGISFEVAHALETGVPQSARLLRDAGLAAATLTHRAFAFATTEATTAARERLHRSIAVAAEIGAPSILMTTGGRGALTWIEAAQRFAEAIAPCAEAARSAGVMLGIEPTSHLYMDSSLAHRLTDIVTLARMGSINVAIDLFPCWVDADIDAAITEAGPLTSLVQVSDYVLGDRGLPCRAVPGDGTIPLDRLIPAIVHAGFTGWFDLEIIGPRLAAEGREAGLKRAAAKIGALLESAGLPA
jgi:sugar phosphate isomerase/epimerase